jgi:phosphotriesterase-related protein
VNVPTGMSESDTPGMVWTVTGPVAASALGRTSPHEHIFVNIECWLDPPTDDDDRAPAASRVDASTMATVRANPFAVRDNLVLDDLAVAIEEVGRFRAAGGRTLVDLTLDDIGRAPARLRTVSEATGVLVVMGCGHYIAAAHPPELRDRSLVAFRDEILFDLLVGPDGIRAGVIGEIGTSDPIDPVEARVLGGACAAQRETGRTLFIHLDPWGRAGHDVLDRCEQAGVDLDRVVLSHLDPSLADVAYARSLAARGAFVGIDIWGDEDAYGGRGMPSDASRTAAVLVAHEEGWADRLLLAQDVCTKTQLHAFGGRGYDHLLTEVASNLRTAGLSVTEVDQLLVDNPRRAISGIPVAVNP